MHKYFLIVSTLLTLSSNTMAKTLVKRGLSGSLECTSPEGPVINLSAKDGIGSLTINENSETILHQDIMLKTITRCSSYGGGCHNAVTMNSRSGDLPAILVPPGLRSDYNSMSINATLEKEGEKLIFTALPGHSSRFTLWNDESVARFGSIHIYDLSCSGTLTGK